MHELRRGYIRKKGCVPFTHFSILFAFIILFFVFIIVYSFLGDIKFNSS
jgi:hypothetical protein